MRSEPLSPDDRAMDQAKLLKQNAGGVGQEAQVATLLATPVERRDAFAQGRARQAGTNAAIESVALSVLGVAEAVPELAPSQTGEYGKGWNAARRRVLDDLGRLRGALVALRRHHYSTKAAPGTLLADTTFVEALYLIWRLDSNVLCRWDIKTGLCTAHPKRTTSYHQCDYNDAQDFMRRMGFNPEDDSIVDLWHEVRARAEHAAALAAELPEEGDASAAQQ
jgi:hypothetical protein